MMIETVGNGDRKDLWTCNLKRKNTQLTVIRSRILQMIKGQMGCYGHKEKISINSDWKQKTRSRKVKLPPQSHMPGLNGHLRPRGEQER